MWHGYPVNEIETSKRNTMSITNEIIEAKRNAGPEAYLTLTATAGDCVLWANEDDASGDDGGKALKRWTLSSAEESALIESGEVNDVN